MIYVLIVVGLLGLCSSAAFYIGFKRLLRIEHDLSGVQQRFVDGGVDLADQLATDVVITEKWADWDNLTEENIDAKVLAARKPDVWDD